MATVKPIDAAEPMVAMQEAPVAELAVNKSIQQPARKDSPSATQVVVNSGSDSELLMAADIGYVVQLLGASQRASANKFIQDWQPNVAKQLYQYRTQFRQKDWFVVVLGIFPDRAAAQTAVSQLPKQLRSAKPWVRPLADVQKVLE
jgi:DamX protein